MLGWKGGGIFELYFNDEINCYKCVDIKSRQKQCVPQKGDWSDVYTRLVELLSATKKWNPLFSFLGFLNEMIKNLPFSSHS